MNLFLDRVTTENGFTGKSVSEALEEGFELASLESTISREVASMEEGIRIMSVTTESMDLVGDLYSVDRVLLATIATEDSDSKMKKAWEAVKTFVANVYKKLKGYLVSFYKWVKSIFVSDKELDEKIAESEVKEDLKKAKEEVKKQTDEMFKDMGKAEAERVQGMKSESFDKAFDSVIDSIKEMTEDTKTVNKVEKEVEKLKATITKFPNDVKPADLKNAVFAIENTLGNGIDKLIRALRTTNIKGMINRTLGVKDINKYILDKTIDEIDEDANKLSDLLDGLPNRVLNIVNDLGTSNNITASITSHINKAITTIDKIIAYNAKVNQSLSKIADETKKK